MKKILDYGERGGHRGYKNNAARKHAIRRLHEMGFNYFVCYKDVQSNFALSFGNAEWVKPGNIHVDW